MYFNDGHVQQSQVECQFWFQGLGHYSISRRDGTEMHLETDYFQIPVT